MSFHPVGQYPPDAAHPSNPWSPGYMKRFPWLGLGAMMGSLSALAACVGILVASNGKPIASWSVQPSVYLAIAVPLVNLLLTFSLSESLDVAWWRKATMAGTTVSDLHRVWNYGRSVKEALLAGRHTNLVAVACILATLAQINSPLLQRASTVVERSQTTDVTIKLNSAESWPNTWYSGYISGRAYAPTLFTPQFSSVVQDYTTNTSVKIQPGHGCEGLCRTRLKGLGIAVKCSTYSEQFDLRPHLLSDGTYDVTQDPSVNGTDVFYIDVSWFVEDAFLNISTLYKDTNQCYGSLSGQTCYIIPATVQYPVIIDGPGNTIQLDPSSQVWDDSIISEFNFTSMSIQGANLYSGYYLALMNKYNSSVHMRWTGAVGYTIDAIGSSATQYAVLDTDSSAQAFDTPRNCTVGFRNPIADVLVGARELMFRTSLAMPSFNSSFGTEQTLSASQSTTRAVFHSNYLYLAGAVIVTAIAMLVVISVFKGYSELGRPVTLSPIEIAKAFNAPLLRSTDSNMPIEELIKEIGTQSVRYGAVNINNAEAVNGTGPRMRAPFKDYSQYVGINEIGVSNARSRLCMADEDVVVEPLEGQTFIGGVD